MHFFQSCISLADMLKQLQLTCKHICSCRAEPADICHTCLRPAAMPLRSYPTNGLVSTIAPDHQTCMLQLHLTSSHDFISCILSACMSVTVSSYQHSCMLHLHPAISHVCNNCIRPCHVFNTCTLSPAATSVKLASASIYV